MWPLSFIYPSSMREHFGGQARAPRPAGPLDASETSHSYMAAGHHAKLTHPATPVQRLKRQWTVGGSGPPATTQKHTHYDHQGPPLDPHHAQGPLLAPRPRAMTPSPLSHYGGVVMLCFCGWPNIMHVSHRLTHVLGLSRRGRGCGGLVVVVPAAVHRSERLHLVGAPRQANAEQRQQRRRRRWRRRRRMRPPHPVSDRPEVVAHRHSSAGLRVSL